MQIAKTSFQADKVMLPNLYKPIDRFVWNVAGACFVAAAFAGCSSSFSSGGRSFHEDSSRQQPAATGKLVITGSSTCAPLVTEIARRYEQQHPGVRIDVQTGGSSRGIADVRSGLADIGMVSRKLKSEEHDVRAHPFAKDGICIIVNRANPVQELTDEQIMAIYTRKIANWRDVGGADAPITVVNKAEGRSTLELFLNYFKLQSADVQPHVVIGDNEQGVKTVAGNVNAIGYVSIGTAEYDAGQGVAVKLLPLGGAAASIETVAGGEFPLSRTLNLVTSDEPTGLVRAFLEFAQSARVHDLLQEQYFVPLKQ